MSSIACCRACAEQSAAAASRSCSRCSTSTPAARHAYAHCPVAAASSKLPAMCASSSGGSSPAPRGAAPSATRALYSSLLYRRLYSKKRAVERYTAPSHRTTPPRALQLIQRYTALYTIQLYSLYSIQRYTITLWAECGPSRSLRRVRSSRNQLQDGPKAAPCPPYATRTTCRAEEPASIDATALNGSSAGARSFAGDAVAFDEE